MVCAGVGGGMKPDSQTTKQWRWHEVDEVAIDPCATDKIFDALCSYRCCHTLVDERDSETRGGMPLADLLAPKWADSIAVGEEELGELAAQGGMVTPWRS